MMARILVIDDDAEMRVLAEQILKSSKHEVVLAADGKEGMKKFRADPADLVIINLYMPDQEGLETIIELRRFFPEVGVMAMSSRAASRTMLAVAQALGATEILQKPFFAKEMLTAVERTLLSNDYLCKGKASSGMSFDCLCSAAQLADCETGLLPEARRADSVRSSFLPLGATKLFAAAEKRRPAHRE